MFVACLRTKAAVLVCQPNSVSCIYVSEANNQYIQYGSSLAKQNEKLFLQYSKISRDWYTTGTTVNCSLKQIDKQYKWWF